jgi:hypothetical protein
MIHERFFFGERKNDARKQCYTLPITWRNMPGKKREEKSFFRPLIGNAVSHAWHHRELWPIAAIAGLAGIGAAVNDVLTQARLSSTLPGTDPLTLLTSISFTREMLASIVLQGPYAIIITTITGILLILIGAGMLAWCQHIILRASHHTMTSKASLSMNELAKDAAHPRLLRILTIDAFIKILIINLLIVTSILVSNLQPTQFFFDALFGTIFSAFTIIIAFALNIWGMFALIGVVKKNTSIVHALEAAWKTMKTHPVACAELSLVLFAVTFAISILAIVGLILIGSLSIPFFSLMISQGTLTGITIITFCTVLLGATWAVAAAGFSTLVTYLSWNALDETFTTTKKPQTARSSTHAKRTLKHLFG